MDALLFYGLPMAAFAFAVLMFTLLAAGLCRGRRAGREARG